MKNRGFTLIEMLITITLLAAITVTVGLSMSNLLDRQDNKDMENYKNDVEKAACVWAELHNVAINEERNVDIGTLIDDGLLKTTVTNPKTKKSVKEYRDKIIKIKWEDNEKKCECDCECQDNCD